MSCEVALHNRSQGGKVLGVSHVARDRQFGQCDPLAFADPLPGYQLQAVRSDGGNLDHAVTNRHQLVATHFPKNDLCPANAKH